jgi:hypothetical protein
VNSAAFILAGPWRFFIIKIWDVCLFISMHSTRTVFSNSRCSITTISSFAAYNKIEQALRRAFLNMYPKTFFESESRQIRTGTCFVVMPFAKQFDPVFTVMKSVLSEEMGMSCTRTDELLGGGNIIEDILREIATSELIIVDVTGKNPNVFYELGITHMCKAMEKVLLLSQEVDSIPFDLRPFRHIIYSPTAKGLKALSIALKEATNAVSQKVHRIFLDSRGKGALADRLMGSDRSLYGFEIFDGYPGHQATKLRLQVTRFFITDKQNTEVVFNSGIGLVLGESTSIRGTQWVITYELAPDGALCFRISGNASEKRRPIALTQISNSVTRQGTSEIATKPVRKSLLSAAKQWIDVITNAKSNNTIVAGQVLPPSVSQSRQQFEAAWSNAREATRFLLAPDIAYEALSQLSRLYRLIEHDSSIQANANSWADVAIQHFSDRQHRYFLTESLLDKAAIYLDIAQLGANDKRQFESMAHSGDAIMIRAYQTADVNQRPIVLRLCSRFYYSLARPASFRLSDDWDNNYLLLAYEKAKEAFDLSPADLKSANQLARVCIKVSKNPLQASDPLWAKRLRDSQRKLKKAWLNEGPKRATIDGRLSPLNVLGVVTLETIAREWQAMDKDTRIIKEPVLTKELDKDALGPLREAVALLQNSELRKSYSFDLSYDISRSLALKCSLLKVCSPTRCKEVFNELTLNLLQAREHGKAAQIEAALSDLNGEITFSFLSKVQIQQLQQVLSVVDRTTKRKSAGR